MKISTYTTPLSPGSENSQRRVTFTCDKQGQCVPSYSQCTGKSGICQMGSGESRQHPRDAPGARPGSRGSGGTSRVDGVRAPGSLKNDQAGVARDCILSRALSIIEAQTEGPVEACPERGRRGSVQRCLPRFRTPGQKRTDLERGVDTLLRNTQGLSCGERKEPRGSYPRGSFVLVCARSRRFGSA